MFGSRKKTQKIPMLHDLEKMFKHFQDDEAFDMKKDDFDKLTPEDHGYAVQMYFIR
jgi:hypothetical protein